MSGVRGLSQLLSTLESDKEVRNGCLVDNSILFALSYPLDAFNHEAEQAFNVLTRESIPVFTNVNIRTEVIELHRRVAIPEALIDLLEDAEKILDDEIVQQLKSIRTSYRKFQKEERPYKLGDRAIKKYRQLLQKYESKGKDGWEQFCEDYLTGAIQSIWDTTVNQWNLNFISLSATEKHPLIQQEVTWENMVKLVERFGLGSMDAMILNLFQCSTLNVVLTADSDLAYAAQRLKLKNKLVFIPDSLLNA